MLLFTGHVTTSALPLARPLHFHCHLHQHRNCHNLHHFRVTTETTPSRSTCIRSLLLAISEQERLPSSSASFTTSSPCTTSRRSVPFLFLIPSSITHRSLGLLCAPCLAHLLTCGVTASLYTMLFRSIKHVPSLACVPAAAVHCLFS